MVCIIDDREDVWNFAPNLVHVKPYNFFKNTGDINDPSGFKARQLNTLEEKIIPATDAQAKNESAEGKVGEEDSESKIIADKDGEEGEAQEDIQITEDDSSQDTSEGAAAKKPESSYEKVQDDESLKDDLFEVDDTDDYLVYLEDILTTIHTAYYDLYKQMKERGEEGAPDLKTVIPYVKRKVLQGTTLVFSGVVPTNVPLRKSRAYMVARSLGANVDEKLSAEPGHETVSSSIQ
jgi:RNA polymerase II subunit A-like phosphatase